MTLRERATEAQCWYMSATSRADSVQAEDRDSRPDVTSKRHFEGAHLFCAVRTQQYGYCSGDALVRRGPTGLERAPEAVLTVDEPSSFDDLSIDSDAFGEIVAADIAEQRDVGYQVVNWKAVSRGLAGDVIAEAAGDATSSIE